MEILHHFNMEGNRITADHISYKQIEMNGFRLHSHDTWELLYVKEGSISYMVEGRCYAVDSGSCILSRPGIRHAITFRNNSTYDRYAILFTSPLFYTLPDSLEVVSLSTNPSVRELFDKMDFYIAYLEEAHWGTALSNLTEEVLLNLKIILDKPLQTYTANPIVVDAITYIDRHLSEEILLEDLCNHLHITKSYLHRLFVAHLQLPPARYISAKRLHKARTAIRAGAKPTVVYDQCGFQDYCTFYRNYLRHFGYPPSEEYSHPPFQTIEW